MKIYTDKTKRKEISSVEDWRQSCPPADPNRQWVDKYSAKEMAKFWTDNKNQNEFLLFLRSIKNSLIIEYAIPELANKFDDYKSPRKNDLCVFASQDNKEIFISIEGKSDEHFGGKYITEEWIESIHKKNHKDKSKKLDRIIGLYERYNCDSKVLKLRYQLVYWLAGAIDEAIRNKIHTVFLIVQEFHSDRTNEKKILKNQNDLDSLISFLSNSVISHVNKNDIVGPIKNHYTKQIDLYIGKFCTSIT